MSYGMTSIYPNISANVPGYKINNNPSYAHINLAELISIFTSLPPILRPDVADNKVGFYYDLTYINNSRINYAPKKIIFMSDTSASSFSNSNLFGFAEIPEEIEYI